MTSAVPIPPLPRQVELRRRIESHLAALRCQLQVARSGIPDTFDVVNCTDGGLVLKNIILSDFAQLNGL